MIPIANPKNSNYIKMIINYSEANYDSHRILKSQQHQSHDWTAQIA